MNYKLRARLANWLRVAQLVKYVKSPLVFILSRAMFQLKDHTT